MFECQRKDSQFAERTRKALGLGVVFAESASHDQDAETVKLRDEMRAKTRERMREILGMRKRRRLSMNKRLLR